MLLPALLAFHGFSVAYSFPIAYRVHFASRSAPHARACSIVGLLESDDILEQERRLEKLEKELESELEMLQI